MAKYRSKKASCGLCKPHKKGWENKHKFKDQQKMDTAKKEISESFKKIEESTKQVNAGDLLPPNDEELKRLATIRDDEIDFSDIPETEFDLLPGWNYRIMKHVVNDEVFYRIHQVHYDKNGEPVLFTECSITPYGCTKKALKKDIKRMLKAFTKPVLDYKKKT